jgi:hypothetical protein
LLKQQWFLRIFTITGLVTLLFACEEPVDLGFEVVESQLVVSSTFFPDDFVKVHLSATQPTVGEQSINEITDATVSILEGNETKEVLHYVASQNGRRGSYQSSIFKPKVGRSYTLFATKSGFKPIDASSSIPEPVEIVDLEIIDDVSRMTIEGLEIFTFTLKINYDDPEFAENFYDIRISQLVMPYFVKSNGDTVKMGTKAKVVQAPIEDYAENTIAGEASILVRDRPAEDGLTIKLQSRFDPRIELLGDLRAELRTVSEPYFDYQLTIQREGQALPIGIGDPRVSSFGNVQQGIGVFAGYNRVFRTFNLDN